MKLRVLGSSGSEFPNYNAPAFLIDDVLLLDAGTIGPMLDARAQWKIKNILLTHAHLDHIKGIPFLADNIILRSTSHYVTIMGVSSVLRTLKKHLLNDRVWPDFTSIPNPDSAVLRLKNIRFGKPFNANGYKVTAHAVNHSVPAAGYILETGNGKTLLYTGDTGPTEAIWKATEKQIDCAIVEVSMPNRMKQMAITTGHLTANLLKNEIMKMNSMPRRILITHPKPQYFGKIRTEIQKLGMNNIRLLRDGKEYRI